MELISYLKADHKNIRRIIKEIEQAELRENKARSFEELIEVLNAHLEAVEVAVFTAGLKNSNSEIVALTVKGFNAHQSLDELVLKTKFSIQPENWESEVKQFCQVLEKHLSDQASDYFPSIKKCFKAVESDRAAVLYLKIKKAEYTRAQQDKKYKIDKEVQLAN